MKNMIRIVLAFALCYGVAAGWAQYPIKCTNIKGWVEDANTREPIPQALVWIRERPPYDRWHTTLDSGRFDILIPFGLSEQNLYVGHPRYKTQTRNILEIIIDKPVAQFQLVPADSLMLSPGEQKKVLAGMWKRLESQAAPVGNLQQGVLRMSQANALTAVIAATVFPAGREGMHRVSVYGAVPDLAAAGPSMLEQADAVWPSVLDANVFAAVNKPLAPENRANYIFTCKAQYRNDPRTATVRIAYTCSQPSRQVTGLDGVKSLSGECWVDPASFAIVRHQSWILFEDGRKLNTLALYQHWIQASTTRYIYNYTPLALISNETSAEGDFRTSEWHVIYSGPMPMQNLASGFAASGATAPPLRDDFWISFWYEKGFPLPQKESEATLEAKPSGYEEKETVPSTE